MPYPGLAHEDHRILGSDFCSGFTDIYGKWNTGFYCPQYTPTIPVFCCGTTYYKYCCVAKADSLNGRDIDVDGKDSIEDLTPFTVRVPVVFAIFCGVLAVLVLLVTASCFFCSCCIAYKKRRGRDNGPFSGLYHIQGSSSTTSALASIYSTQNSNNSIVSTPLDCGNDWSTLSPGGSFTYIPYPLSTSSANNNSQNHYATPSHASSASSTYPSSLTIPNFRGGNHGLNFNNNPNLVSCNNNLSVYNNLNNNQQNRRNQNFSSIYQQYQQNHSGNGNGGGRPASVLSTYSTNSSMSTLPTTNSSCGGGRVLNASNGLYHVTDLRAPSGERPPPTYSFRTARSNLSEHVELQSQLQQLLSLQSNTGGRVSRSPNVQQTRFINQQNRGASISCSNTNTTQPNQNLRQLLLEREQMRQQRSSNNNANNYNTLRPMTQNSGNHGQNERLNLATIQSLINAYRSNCGGNGPQSNSLPLSLQSSTQPAGNPSLTTADVNRLNAINIIVSALLNQRQSGGESRRNVGESAPSSRPLLLLLDGVIRASSISSSGSGGESVTSTNTNETTTTSGIGGSVSSGGESCSGMSDTTLRLTEGKKIAGTTNTDSPLKIKDLECKNLSCSQLTEKVASGNGNTSTNGVGGSDDGVGDYDKERQKPIIEIIETSVPFKDGDEGEEKCFDVDNDKENGEKIKRDDYIYSLEDGGKDDKNMSMGRNEHEQSELSLEHNLNLESKLDCCFDEMNANLIDGDVERGVNVLGESHLKQETSVIVDELPEEPDDRAVGKSSTSVYQESNLSSIVEIVQGFES